MCLSGLAPPPVGVGTTSSSSFTGNKKNRETCIDTRVLWTCLFIILYGFVILYPYFICIPPNHIVSPTMCTLIHYYGWPTRTYNFHQQMAVQINAYF